MFKRILILVAALLFSSLTSPVFAADNNGEPDNSSAQQDKNSDFDDWYKPDDAYQPDDKNQPTENVVSPNGGEDEPRVAPLEDTRQKEQ